MCRYPNLIDGHEYDDGYETGVGDLMSHKYKLPSLPPPSSSPYSSLSSSSSSQQQQQSPSYNMGGGGNSGNNMSHYQQQQYLQNQAQYPSAMQQHQNHMNSFNYHHPFGRMQQQQQPQQMSNVVKNESDNDPYRFVDDDLSNGMNYQHHQNAQHMSSPASFSPASSSHMQQPQGNAPMMQYNEHHMSSPHHMHGLVNHVNHMGTHPQQVPSQAQQHMMNGGQNVGMPGGMNSSNTSAAMMMMNDTPKKRGRKKKTRDENG